MKKRKKVLPKSKFPKLFRGKSVQEIIDKCCGEKIGEGLYRDVYVLKANTDYVVKIEVDMSRAQFANATEWRNYINNKEWRWFAKFLAPCEMINETSQVMVQKRITHPESKKDYPKEIPSMFTDTKLANFGFIGKQFVCCDYSFIPFTLSKFKTKKATWWK